MSKPKEPTQGTLADHLCKDFVVQYNIQRL